jgi:type IV pilus assembly protein PilA
MKKQGFTLIELMVVIVIMGILAAVAVPKLFGMIAKSKASEVGPAAGEYVKLQDAFISETGTTYGSWKWIGYNMPSTSVFVYDSTAVGTNGTTDLPTNFTKVWSAVPVADLNSCTHAAGWWKLSIKQGSGTGNGAEYEPRAASADCNVLAPSFGKVGGGSATAIGGSL